VLPQRNGKLFGKMCHGKLSGKAVDGMSLPTTPDFCREISIPVSSRAFIQHEQFDIYITTRYEQSFAVTALVPATEYQVEIEP
jgi:hypothetical protein